MSLLAAPVQWWSQLATPVQDRLVGLVLAAPSGTVLAIARWLTPSAEGVGTHRQLGLSGCTVLTNTGYPCPMCGMTTTFSHMAHFDPVSAVINQPFGVVLFSATLVLCAVGLADLLVPTGRWRKLASLAARYEVWLAGGLLAGLGAGWVCKVVMMGV